MKIIRNFIYLFIFFTVFGCANSVEVSQQKLDKAFELYKESNFDDRTDNQEILNLVTEAIDSDPNNFSAFRFRATLFTQQKKYDLALKDVKKMTSLQPKVPTYEMLECMLREWVEQSIPWDCYQKIADGYDKNSFEYLNYTRDGDYISAYLFLNNKDIKKYAIEAFKKENFPIDTYDLVEDFITNFDRDEYLNEIFPL